MPLILQSRIYRTDLQANPHILYVFGDNQVRRGLGGQAAEMRGEPNAVGIATLAAPGLFWSDADRSDNCATIAADMAPLFEALGAYRTIVFPLDGVGTGLADLANRAPQTFAYLQSRIAELKTLGGR